MTIPTMLLGTVLCAIHWFAPDGTQKNKGKYLWPPEAAQSVVVREKARDPTLVVTIDCKEQ